MSELETRIEQWGIAYKKLEKFIREIQEGVAKSTNTLNQEKAEILRKTEGYQEQEATLERALSTLKKEEHNRNKNRKAIIIQLKMELGD